MMCIRILGSNCPQFGTLLHDCAKSLYLILAVRSRLVGCHGNMHWTVSVLTKAGTAVAAAASIQREGHRTVWTAEQGGSSLHIVQTHQFGAPQGLTGDYRGRTRHADGCSNTHRNTLKQTDAQTYDHTACDVFACVTGHTLCVVGSELTARFAPRDLGCCPSPDPIPSDPN